MHLRAPDESDRRTRSSAVERVRRGGSRARNRRDRLHGARLLLRADAPPVVDAATTWSAASTTSSRTCERGRRGKAARLSRSSSESRSTTFPAARRRPLRRSGALPVGLRARLDPLPRRPRRSTRSRASSTPIGAERSWGGTAGLSAVAARSGLVRLTRAPRPRQVLRRGDRLGLGRRREPRWTASRSRSRARACTSRTASSIRMPPPRRARAARDLPITLASTRMCRRTSAATSTGRSSTRARPGYETVHRFDRRQARQEPLG